MLPPVQDGPQVQGLLLQQRGRQWAPVEMEQVMLAAVHGQMMTHSALQTMAGVRPAWMQPNLAGALSYAATQNCKQALQLNEILAHGIAFNDGGHSFNLSVHSS